MMNGLKRMIISSLNIYFSDACNLNCSYCCMQNKIHNNNIFIQQALQDGSYFQNIKPYITKDIKHIGIWGMEPSINGKYFNEFITTILNYSPYIRYITIATNGLGNIYEYFTLPLMEYVIKNKRKLKLWIQYSLDGPQFLTDSHYYAGAYNTILQNIQISTIPWHSNSQNYLKCRITFKPTFMPQDWYIDPNIWYTWRDNLHWNLNIYEYYNLINCEIITPIAPTFAHGFNYTKNDGEAFARWKIEQPLLTHTCGAGLNSITIDCQGNVYDCPLLCNRQDINQQLVRLNFDNKMDELIANNEVIDQDRDKLFQVLMSNYCFAVDNINDLTNYIRLFGNGALL